MTRIVHPRGASRTFPLWLALALAVLVSTIRSAEPKAPLFRSQPDPQVKTEMVGELRYHSFTSRVFGNRRTLRVLLPPGYDEEANQRRRYPVPSLNDGQNLFDASTSLFNPFEWQVDETLARLYEKQRVPPLIVVGIDSADRRLRPKEYLPYPDEYLEPPEPDPQGKQYPRFLVEEVMPFINGRYRTQTAPESTGLGGSSYGATAALHTVIRRPGVFGRLLLESPALYISDYQLLQDARRCEHWPGKIYLGVGTHETDREDWNQEAVQQVRELKAILEQAGLGDDRLLLVVEEGARHDERAWAGRFPTAIKFLFGKIPTTQWREE